MSSFALTRVFLQAFSFVSFLLKTTIGRPGYFIGFLLRRRNREPYCVALVMPPRRIVLYAFVAITARALYPRPPAPPRNETL